MLRILIILTACCCCLGLCAQTGSSSNLRSKKLFLQQRVTMFDTLSLVPGTFSLKGFLPNQYTVNEADATLTWLADMPAEGIDITYRVFPFRLGTANRRFLFDSIGNKFVSSPGSKKCGRRVENSIVDFDNLTYSGSRSLSLLLPVQSW